MTARVEIPINIEDALARAVTKFHVKLFEGLVAAAADIAGRFGFHATEGLIVTDADRGGFVDHLIRAWAGREVDPRILRLQMNAQMVAGERAFFRRFMDRTDPQIRVTLRTFSVDKDEVFAQNIQGLRELYLDEAVERIQGEQDDLKADFLLKLLKWVSGEDEELDVADLVEEMRETAGNKARFFARDQFSRFERSLTVASYEAAEAPYIEVFTANDARVRPTHQQWQHKIFTPSGLTADFRWSDHNCRCGFVPRWELTKEMEGRFVA